MLFRLPSFPRRFGRGLLLALAAGLIATARAQETGVAGTMPEDGLPGLKAIIDAAIRESPSMVSYQLQVAMADAQKMIVGVQPLLPSVGSSFGYGKSIQTVSNGNGASSGTSGLIYNGNVSQNIFQWGALKNQLETQKINELIQEKSYAEAYRTFVGKLRREYLALIVNKIDLRNARYGLKLSQEALAIAQDKLRHGTFAGSDMAGPEIDADERQLAVDRVEQTYLFARRSLAHEVGQSDLADESIPLEIPPPKYSPAEASYLLAGLETDGGRSTFQAQIQEMQIHNADLNYKIARVRLLPRFYANAALSQSTSTSATPTSVLQTLVTTKSYYLNASWTLFDGLATHWAKVQALESKRYYERQLQIVTDSVLDSAENARHTVDFDWRALRLADRRSDMAQGGLAHTENEYKLGNSPQEDVAAATNGVYLNDSAVASARAEFLSSWSDFVSLAGADPAMNKLPTRYVRDIQ